MKTNAVTVSGEVSSIKPLKGGHVFMVIRQRKGRCYNFFACSLTGNTGIAALEDIMPGDMVVVTGKLGNWSIGGSGKYKSIVIEADSVVTIGGPTPSMVNADEAE